MSCPLTNAIFGIVGVLVGGLIGHWLAGIRDSAARKRAFIGFLEKWKAEISTPDRGPTTIGVSIHPAIKTYDTKVGTFREQVELVRGVFSDGQTFNTLTVRLGNLKTEDWDKKNPRDVICEAIDALLEFAKK